MSTNESELAKIFGANSKIAKIGGSEQFMSSNVIYLGKTIIHNGNGLYLFKRQDKDFLGLEIKTVKFKNKKYLEDPNSKRRNFVIRDHNYDFRNRFKFYPIKIIKLVKHSTIELVGDKQIEIDYIRHNLISCIDFVYNPMYQLKSKIIDKNNINIENNNNMNNNNEKDEKSDNDENETSKKKKSTQNEIYEFLLIYIAAVKLSQTSGTPSQVLGYLCNEQGKPAGLCQLAVFGSSQNAFYKQYEFNVGEFYLITSVWIRSYNNLYNLSLSTRSVILNISLFRVKYILKFFI